jgi:DedD protein
MGLFSFLNKNKQDTTGEDSGYFSRDEDSAATRARSKRASSANEPASPRGKKSRSADDPVLPEKKRARRRLVGAVALALAVAVGLPMLLDAEPKPMSSDISIQIPSRDKAPPLPVPAAPGAAVLPPVLPSVLPADSLDRREEIVEAPKPQPADVKPVFLDAKGRASESRPPVLKAETKSEPKLARVDPAPAAPKPAAPKPAAKVDEKPAVKPAKTPPESARALDLLEGKTPEPANEKFIVQVAALGSAEKVAELQGRLKAAGIRSFTHKVSTPSGERIQVKLGPFSHDEAEKMHARLEKAGLPGSMVRLDVK